MNSQSISFGRHVIAILFASMFASIGGAIFLTAFMAIVAGGNVAVVIVVAPIVWLGLLVPSLCGGAFFFTLAWPVLRKSGAKGQGIAVLGGALAFVAVMLSYHSLVGSGTGKRGEILTAVMLGAAVGWAYWWWACPQLRTIFRRGATSDKNQLVLPL